MFNKCKRGECNLFPYIQEEVFGLFESNQQIPWSLEKFKIDELWKFSSGENVIVAVIDSGCDLDHEDLKNNFVQGKNFLSDTDPYDDNSHGTHVAGTICAKNNHIGVVGVAPSTKIMPIKVLSSNGNGDNGNVANAIVWAADNKADIICMSLGSPYQSNIIEKALNYALNKGCVAFCAAGNAGENSDIYYPAKYEQTVSTGAIDDLLNRTSFTCKGRELDFLAPGKNILSTIPGNRYALMSGTSMANPFVVGCASLLLSYIRKNNSQIKLQNANDYIQILKKYTTHVNNINYNLKIEYEGYGILDPLKFNYWEDLK